MPLLKASAGKATPRKAITYITRKDKVRFVDVQNLFEDEDYAEQFAQTAARFGKYTATARESIITTNSLPTEPTMPTRSWCKSMRRRARKRCSRAASALSPRIRIRRPFMRT